jgi:DNA-binding NarL/FixJ family response regulator
MLARDTSLEVIGVSSDVSDAVRAIQSAGPIPLVTLVQLQPDVLLRFVKTIRNASHSVQFVAIVASLAEAQHVNQFLGAGVKAVVSLGDSRATVLEAVHNALARKAFIGHSVANGMAIAMSSNPDNPALMLSRREFETFRLYGEGLGTREIATKLNVSIKTIQHFVEGLKLKMGFKNIEQLMHAAVRWCDAQSLGVAPASDTLNALDGRKSDATNQPTEPT